MGCGGSQPKDGKPANLSTVPIVIMIIGSKGSGKRSHAERLAKEFGMVHISIGDKLQQEKNQNPNGPIGKTIADSMKIGKSVPGDIVVNVLKNTMKAEGWEKKIFVIDGFPRNKENMASWQKIVGASAYVPLVIYLSGTAATCEKRLLAKLNAEGKKYENPIPFNKKYEAFQKEVGPLIKELEKRSIYKKIDNETALDVVYAQIKREAQDISKLRAPVLLQKPKVTPTPTARPIATVSFILGGPGSGKTTVANQMIREYHIIKLSVEELLISSLDHPKHGKSVSEALNSHNVLGGEILVSLIEEAMQKLGWEKKTYLIDGFPMNQDHYDQWTSILGNSTKIKDVIFLDAKDETLLARSQEKAKTSGKMDANTPELIQKNIKYYHDSTYPILGQFEKAGTLRKLSAEKSIADVAKDLGIILETSGSQKREKAPVILVTGNEAAKARRIAEKIAKDLKFTFVSTSDILAQPQEPDVRAALSQGKKEEASARALKNAFTKFGAPLGKYVLEGFYETNQEAQVWKEFLSDLVQIKFVIYLEIPGAQDKKAQGLKDIVKSFETEGILKKIQENRPLDLVYDDVSSHLGTLYKIRGKPRVVFVLGGPGSGKGTQCAKIAKDYGFVHLSVGDLLREEQKKGGEIAQKLEQYIKDGLLVPAEIPVTLLNNAMQEKGWDKSKFLIDGFPRNQDNANVWDKMLGDEVDVKLVLFYECSLEVMEKRLLERGKSSGRSDDNPETIKKRFNTFTTETKPVADNFEKNQKLKRISAESAVELIYEETTKVLDPYFHRKEKAKTVIVIGNSGTGHGTQSKKAVKDYGLVLISVGSLLKEEISAGSDIGKQADALVKGGKLVPSNLVAQAIKNKMKSHGFGKSKFLVDGFPRTQENLEALNKEFGDDLDIKTVLYFDCSPEVAKTRLAQKSGDPKQAALLSQELKFVVDFYEKAGLLKTVRTERSIEKVYGDVRIELDKYFIKRERPRAIFMLGAPGSGVKTQSERIVKDYGLALINVPELIKAEINLGTPIGKEMQEYKAQKNPIPSPIIISLIRQALVKGGWGRGKFLITGFPKNQENYENWKKIMTDEVDIKCTLHYECSQETFEVRSADRKKSKEAALRKYQKYKSLTRPLLESLAAKGKVQKINGDENIEVVYQNTQKIVDEYFKKLDKPLVIFVIGTPGSGKKTICERIEWDFGFVYIKLADLQNKELLLQSEDGKAIDDCLKNKKPIPETINTKLIKNAMLKAGWSRCKFLIDGFPETMEELNAWHKEFENTVDVKNMFTLEISLKTLEARNKNLKPEELAKLKDRYNKYKTDTKAVLSHFESENKVEKINAEKPVDIVYDFARDQLDTYLKRKPTPIVFFVVGGPATGKATQSEKLVHSFGFVHFLVRDLLVQETTNNGAYAKVIDECARNGKKIPSDVLVCIIKKAMSSSKGTRFLIDGFPKNEDNNQTWERMIGTSANVKGLIAFECSYHTLEKRGRAAGIPIEKIKKKYEEYNNETKQIVRRFENVKKIIKINAEGSIEEVHTYTKRIVEKMLM